MKGFQPIKKWLCNFFGLFCINLLSLYRWAIDENAAPWLCTGIQKVNYEFHSQIILIFFSLTSFYGTMVERVSAVWQHVAVGCVLSNLKFLFFWAGFAALIYISGSHYLALHSVFLTVYHTTYTDVPLNKPFTYRCRTSKDVHRKKINWLYLAVTCVQSGWKWFDINTHILFLILSSIPLFLLNYT